MNKKVLSYALAAALMLPVSVASAKSMAMPLVQQTQASEDNTKGTQFFKGTFAQALAKAKQENKKLMVDCYTLWCGPCHYMATNVFPNDTLGKFMNEHFVCMKVLHSEALMCGRSITFEYQHGNLHSRFCQSV